MTSPLLLIRKHRSVVQLMLTTQILGLLLAPTQTRATELPQPGPTVSVPVTGTLNQESAVDTVCGSNGAMAYLSDSLMVSDGYIVSGYCWPGLIGKSFLYKIDFSGFLNNTFGIQSEWGYLQGILANPGSNEFFVWFDCGSNQGCGPERHYVAKYSNDGKKLWQRNLSSTYFSGADITLDGDILVQDYRKVWRIGSDGNIKTEVSFPVNLHGYVAGITTCDNRDAYVLAWNAYPQNVILGKFNSNYDGITYGGPVAVGEQGATGGNIQLNCDESSHPIARFQIYDSNWNVRIKIARFNNQALDVNFGASGIFEVANPWIGTGNDFGLVNVQVVPMIDDKILVIASSGWNYKSPVVMDFADRYFVVDSKGRQLVEPQDIPTGIHCHVLMCAANAPVVVPLANGFFGSLRTNRILDGGNAQAELTVFQVSIQSLLTPRSPKITSTTSADRQVTFHFLPPIEDGGSPVLNYEYSVDGGATWSVVAPSRTTSPIVIAGLTNGTNYSVKLRAVNSVGSGEESNAVLVTPQTTASAPTISSVNADSHQATVSFSAPSDNGGAVITNYEYSTDDGATWTAASPAQSSSPLVISGLTNGTTYSIKIRAVNDVGSGAESNAISVKPIAPASAPTISGVVAGNGQATLSITAPSQINDSSLFGYDYSTNNGSTWSRFSSATGPFTITGLTNATAYQVRVRAVNSAGAGEVSAAVTVNPTRLVPAKPVIGSVVGGNASATVNITTPTDVTAQSITSYQYSVDKGATYQNAAVSNGSFTISGLTNGVTTSVQIRATNFNGTSLASVAKTVIPSTTPAAPGITTITPTTGALSVAFTAPNTGGSAITGYQYSLDGGLTWVVPKTAVKSSPIRVTGLPNATNYQVSIRAVNAKGAGSASTAVSATTPVLVPSAPVVTSISKTRTTITIDFDAPVNNGGGTITNYAYSTDRGRTWAVVSPASAATRVVIAGLNPSTLYPVQIAAINSAGRGASSALTGVGTLH